MMLCGSWGQKGQGQWNSQTRAGRPGHASRGTLLTTYTELTVGGFPQQALSTQAEVLPPHSGLDSTPTSYELRGPWTVGQKLYCHLLSLTLVLPLSIAQRMLLAVA
jgi:hypothetical protein